MTEKEFMQQVWRPFDTVTIEGGVKGRVHNVSFPTHSVRIHMPGGPAEWFRCELIIEHTSVTNEPDDVSIIERLHNKLMEAENRIGNQSESLRQAGIKISMLETKISELESGGGSVKMDMLIGKVNECINAATEKKSKAEKLEKTMNELLKFVEEHSKKY